jgi:general secretion pathway protein E/type IV pilus assembly protein PilB
MTLGTLLVESGVLAPDRLEEAVREQRRTGDRLEQVLVRMGFVRRSDLLRTFSERLHLPIIDLAEAAPDAETLRLLPPRIVFKLRCAPVSRAGGSLRIATSDPTDLASFDELRIVTGHAIELVLADEDDLQKYIRQHYGVAGDTLDALGGTLAGGESERAGTDSDEAAQAQEASVVRLVNDLLVEAVRERATDVHIEPYEHDLAIRYRIDGALVDAGVPAAVHRFRNAIVSRLKIMANLNIAEKRRPQDGRISLRIKGSEHDLRVSVIPMLFGEGVVLRILSKSAVLTGLDDLGMPAGIEARWNELIGRPHGILLVTGPTGSGKSTTLYASLRRIVTPDVKAITVEDPVEYHVDGVNQIQVNHQVGLDFAAGLRAILRHDPDIVMIGEIRDKETADAAVQASLTGHLVFSTLHTNDSAGAATRLLDMGVEPFLVASTVEGVLAQRLVRRVCRHCSVRVHPTPAELPPGFGEVPAEGLPSAVGCRECRGTGYRGRVGIYELLTSSEATKELVMARASSSRIAEAAVRSGDLSLLREDAFTKVRAGLTTLDEALQTTRG